MVATVSGAVLPSFILGFTLLLGDTIAAEDACGKGIIQRGNSRNCLSSATTPPKFTQSLARLTWRWGIACATKVASFLFCKTSGVGPDIPGPEIFRQNVEKKSVDFLAASRSVSSYPYKPLQ